MEPLISRLMAVVCAVCTLAGCAIVTTEPIGPRARDGAPEGSGVAYLLPKALLPLELVVNGSQIRIDVLEPIFVGDPDHAHVLRYVTSAFSNDTVKLVVDPKTSLLRSVTLESKDETGEVLKKAIATAVRAESATGGAGTEIVLLQTVLDPGNALAINTVRAQLDDAVTAYLARQSIACRATPAPDYCAGLGALAGGAPPAVVLAVTPMALARSRASFDAAAPDCAVGICYRVAVPYRIDLGLFGQTRSTVVQLPNDGPVVALALARQPLVTVKHAVTLNSGMIESYETVKPSSALALVSWPLEVYDAMVSTTAKIVQLKIDTSRSSVALQEQLLDEARKRRAIEEQLADLKAPKPESARLLGMGFSRALLTVGNGKPPSALSPIASTGPAVVVPVAAPAVAAPPTAPAAQAHVSRGSSGTAGK